LGVDDFEGNQDLFGSVPYDITYSFSRLEVCEENNNTNGNT